jgi:hypothetical protein
VTWPPSRSSGPPPGSQPQDPGAGWCSRDACVESDVSAPARPCPAGNNVWEYPIVRDRPPFSGVRSTRRGNPARYPKRACPLWQHRHLLFRGTRRPSPGRPSGLRTCLKDTAPGRAPLEPDIRTRRSAFPARTPSVPISASGRKPGRLGPGRHRSRPNLRVQSRTKNLVLRTTPCIGFTSRVLGYPASPGSYQNDITFMLRAGQGP